jgi:hypothetical protein
MINFAYVTLCGKIYSRATIDNRPTVIVHVGNHLWREAPAHVVRMVLSGLEREIVK